MADKTSNAQLPGGGFQYLVFAPGVDEPEVLTDDRELDAIVAEGLERFEGGLYFRGASNAAELDGKLVTIRVGRGFAPAGSLVREHDFFNGDTAIEEALGEPAEEPAAAPQPTRPYSISKPKR